MTSTLSSLADSFGSLDAAETQEHLSQDSRSTTSPSPQREDSPSDDDHLQHRNHSRNEQEEQLRRRAQHSSSRIPELRRSPHWHSTFQKDRDTPGDVLSKWHAKYADEVVVPVRWHLYKRTAPQQAPAWSSPWIPFTAPRQVLFPAAYRSALASLCSAADTHSANTHVSEESASTAMTTASARKAQHNASAQLVIGRPMLTGCVQALLTAAAEKRKADEEEEEKNEDAALDLALLREAAATVSRAHCTVYLYLTLNASKAVQLVSLRATEQSTPPAKCHSIDVFALSASTSVKSVPLQPHFRYHFQTAESACVTDGVLTIRLGPSCAVDLVLDTARLAAPAPSATVGKEGVGCSPAYHRPPLRQLSGLGHHNSTTSLFTTDSTAVLATPSNMSEPVALSDDDDGDVLSDGERVLVASSNGDVHDNRGSSQVSVEEAGVGSEINRQEEELSSMEHEDDVPPKLSKRRTPAAATQTKASSRKTRKSAAAAATSTQRAPKKKTASVEQDENSEAESYAAVVVDPPDATVIFTTGLRLSDKEESDLKALGAMVNPPLSYARHARLLVAQQPLMRSVKLLTVLPFIHAVVQQSWLDTVLHTHSLDIPTAGFAYRERKLPGSIESENNFDLADTLDKEPENRQRLLSGLRFWVHKTTAPQDPPMNDLRSVLLASGGAVTRDISEANVLVLPQSRPPIKCWQSILDDVGGFSVLSQRRLDGLLLVVPDDVFKCVLRQRPLLHSTVSIPQSQLTGAKKGAERKSAASTTKSKRSGGGSRSGARQSTQGSRKTPRPSATQRSPRPSARRRSN